MRVYKDFKLASKAKFDLEGQRSLLGNFNEKHCWKDLMKISRMIYELEPFKDFILASKVKVDHRKSSAI